MVQLSNRRERSCRGSLVSKSAAIILVVELVAAILIGLARSFTVYLLPELEVLIPFLIMVLVLLFRPQGLFSVAQSRRV